VKIKVKDSFLKTCLCVLWLNFILVEIFFFCFAFKQLTITFIEVIAFTLSLTLFFTAILSLIDQDIGRYLAVLIMYLSAFYAFLQLELKNFMNAYVSFKQLGNNTNALRFIPTFLASINYYYLLIFLIPFFLSCFILKPYFKRNKLSTTTKINALMIALVSQITFILLSLTGNQTLSTKMQIPEKMIKEYGINQYLVFDLFFEYDEKELEIIELSKLDTSEENEKEIEEDNTRKIDDSNWLELIDEEDNESVKKIDNYLIGREISNYNDYTSYFEDYNVIYMMIEAFDYLAIDEELTPTLYKMFSEGYSFTNHYTPIYSCATGESELVSEISLLPRSDLCTPSAYYDNDYSNSIFDLFSNSSYYTSAYHNWRDEFYPRRSLYSNTACELYLNYDDLEINEVLGWQSDFDLIDQTIDEYLDEDKFFTLYVSSVTHFPYDEDSYWGNYYLDQINEVHPDYPLELKRYLSKAMNLDSALNLLLERLEKAGKSDDTIIVLYADHHPLNLSEEYIREYGGRYVDRSDEKIDLTPFIIYSPSLEGEEFTGINSTLDILPTIANLCGLDYDPRLYIGVDYFSDSENTVIFADGSFINDHESYDSSSGTYLGDEEEDLENKINNINNLFTISYLIYENNYFFYRHDIIEPSYIK